MSDPFDPDYLPDGPAPFAYPDSQDYPVLGPETVPSGLDGIVTDPSLPVNDQRDLRVLIPACRRAIDGPMAMSSGSVAATLTDPEVLGLVADATAELILYTHGHETMGFQLIPIARDPFYLAPIAWATDLYRPPAADAAILSQAALNYYFQTIKTLKVSETIKNEAVDWEYSLSANVISAYMQYLIGNRDKAIASMQSINVPLDGYVSLVANRDLMAARWLEPWVVEVGAPVPYSGLGGMGAMAGGIWDSDFRFDSFG
jgi:hypothetical protein